MKLTRIVARPLLASIFVSAGVNHLQNPGHAAGLVEPLTSQLPDTVPPQLADPEKLVLANAVVQVGAGSALALGIKPKWAALALVGSLVPTTLAGHRFWEIEDPQMKAMQRIQFLKNTALIGGLLSVVGQD